MTHLPGHAQKPSPWCCENCGPVQSEDVDDNACCVLCGGECEYTNRSFAARRVITTRGYAAITRLSRDAGSDAA